MKELIKKTVIGFAIGDAMGVPIEFENRDSLLKRPVTRMIGYGSHDVPKGCWSDDTSMALATMDSITTVKRIDYNNIADCFCEWLNNSKYTATNELFDIGITTKHALINYWNQKQNGYVDASTCGMTGFNENGNGSLMRIFPLVYYFHFNKSSEEEIHTIVKNVSSITHAHEISIMACFMYVNFMLDIIKGLSKLEAYYNLGKYDYSNHFTKETVMVFERIINRKIVTLNIDEIKSSGYVVDTLEAVIWVTLNAENFRDSIVGAINLGNDTDTIGALVGAISGVLYKFETVPVEWLNDLMAKDVLEDLSENYYEFLVESNGIVEEKE